MDKKTKIAATTIILTLVLSTLLLLPNQSITSPTATAAQNQPKTYSIPPQDAPPWWDTTFKYRIPVNVSVGSSANATIPVDVYIDFQALGVSCHNSSLRVQFWNGFSWLPQPGLPYQVWNETANETGHILKATITFHANVTAYGTTTYYIYFSDTNMEAPSFTPQVNATIQGQIITVTGKYYAAYINRTAYGGKIFECYNTISESNWSQTPFHNNPTFRSGGRTYYTNGSPSSFSLNYSSGPLFVTVTSSVLFKDIYGNTLNNTYANITYRFFEWGWICETTTVFQRSSTISSYRCCGYSFDPRIMPNLIYKTSGNRAEQEMSIGGVYQLGSADWFCTLDKSSGVAAGIVDVEPPQFNVTSPSLASWSFTVSYSSSSESWYRSPIATRLSVNFGDFIRECYAFYVWNGTQGSDPFEVFAEAVKSRSVSVGCAEERFFNLTVHALDKDGYDLGGALVEVRDASSGELLLSKTANGTGHASFYLYGGSYNVRVVWNETHEGITYQTYENTTTQINLAEHLLLDVTLNVVNLICHVIYPSGNIFPYINVTITNESGLVSSGRTNATGCIHFRLPPNSYNISLYEDGQLRKVNGSDYLPVEVSSNLTVVLVCTDYTTVTITKIPIMNGTLITRAWTPSTLLLVANWTNSSDGTFVDRSANASYYFKYRVVDSSSGQAVLDWTNLTQSELCYVADLTGLLFGGKTYTVEFMAGGVGLETATNHTTVIIEPVELNESNVKIPVLLGLYYWNHTDIPLVVKVYDDTNGFPVIGANVTWSIGGFGCFQLTDNEDGNYTGFIPKDLLPPGYYTVTFRVECTNYTTYIKDRLVSISPRLVNLSFTPSYDVFFGDEFVFYVYCRDGLTGAPLAGAQVSYVIEGTDFFGSLVDNGNGNYTESFDASLLPSNVSYSVRFRVFLTNYSLVEDKLWLFVKPIPMAAKSVYVSETRWKEILNLTVTLWDAHNNVPVEDAVVNCTVLKDGSVVLVAEFTSLGNGTYVLSVDTQDMLPGKYTALIYAYKGNYSAEPRQVNFEIKRIAAAVTPASFTVLGGFTPYLVLLGGYGEVENGVPFVVLVFEYRDAYGNPVPGATVTANGLPLTHIGDGRYMLVVPTGIPPSTLPFVISASAENYESAQSFQVLTVKERGVTIPGLNIRVPLTILAVLSLAVISPPASLASYVYVRRLRMPPIIRKIDSLIEAIEKGKPVEIKKPLTRIDLIKSLLMEELAIVGVEPRIEAYVPAEVFDKLLPLLTEIGLSEDVAVTLLKELKANPPAERERLLASVGVPPDISTIILSELEKEETRKEEERKEKEEREEEGEEQQQPSNSEP
ncbi:MAG: hypothetical protein QW461_01250 [Candidatus Jordarchaeales archaeon]